MRTVLVSKDYEKYFKSYNIDISKEEKGFELSWDILKPSSIHMIGIYDLR